MAQNPYVNKVEYAGQTLMDLTGDTVTPSSVLNGVTFHDRSGAPQTGSMITHNVYDGLDSTSTDDALSAKQGNILNSNKANHIYYTYTTSSSSFKNELTAVIASLLSDSSITFPIDQTSTIMLVLTGTAQTVQGTFVGTVNRTSTAIRFNLVYNQLYYSGTYVISSATIVEFFDLNSKIGSYNSVGLSSKSASSESDFVNSVISEIRSRISISDIDDQSVLTGTTIWSSHGYYCYYAVKSAGNMLILILSNGSTVLTAIHNITANTTNYSNMDTKINSKYVTENSAFNGSYFPSTKQVKGNGQYTIVARNVNNGAIYALWYDSSVQGFKIGATLYGSTPATNNIVVLYYPVS